MIDPIVYRADQIARSNVVETRAPRWPWRMGRWIKQADARQTCRISKNAGAL